MRSRAEALGPVRKYRFKAVVALVGMLCFGSLIPGRASATPLAVDDLGYEYGGRRINLSLSRTELAIHFNKNAQPDDIQRITGVIGGGLGERSLSIPRTGNLDVIGLQIPLESDGEVLKLIERLKSEPQVSGVFPVLVYGNMRMIATDEVTLRFAPGISRERIDALLSANNLEIRRTFEWTDDIIIAGSAGDPVTNALTLVGALSDESGVVAAEPNFIRFVSRMSAPDDSYFSEQWALDNTGQTGGASDADIDAPEGWDVDEGSSLVTIAIIDDGVDLAHEDLASKLVTGYDATDGDDDPTPNGWDAHGTACAGIAAAATGNATGIAGVAPVCRLMPVRIGYSTAEGQPLTTNDGWIADGIATAAMHGADVLCCSWGNTAPSTLIDFAIDLAKTEGRSGDGCVLLFAAGNGYTSVDYPATNPQVMAIGATNEWDEHKSPTSMDGETGWGSNYGPEISVTAPGVHCWTTDISDTSGYNDGTDPGNGDPAGNYFSNFNGTSCATAHVAGLAGLVLSLRPHLTSDEVQGVIESTADDLGAAGRDDYFGYGRINVHQALDSVRVDLPVREIYWWTITYDQTWHPDTVYVLTPNSNSMAIPNGVTVTIEAGTIVKFTDTGNASYSNVLTVNGTLNLQGTADDPVVFTSIYDDSAGGDSNGDGDATSPSPGKWGFIIFNNASQVVEHCEFKYGGGRNYDHGTDRGMVFANDIPLIIRNNIFKYNRYNNYTIYYLYSGAEPTIVSGNQIMNECSSGIRYEYTGAQFHQAFIDSNVISGATYRAIWCIGNADYSDIEIAGNNLTGSQEGTGIYVENVRPISEIRDNILTDFSYGIECNNASPAVTSNDISVSRTDFTPRYPFYQSNTSFPVYSSNTVGADCYPAIAVTGTVSENGTWVDVEGRGWPYVVQYGGGVYGLKVASGATLTIPAGTVVKMACTDSYMYRRTIMWLAGILDAQGTESNPVYFTSERNDSLGGDSNGDGDATAPAPGDWATIRIDNSANTIQHCEFSYGGAAQENYSNIYCVFNLNNSTPAIRHNKITDSYSGSNGIYCRYSGTSPAVIVGNEIGEGCTNGINCAYTGIDAAPAYLDSNTVAGATQYGIYVLTIPPSSEINHNTVIDCPYGIVTEDASPTVASNDISVTNKHFTPRYPFYQIDTSFPLYSSNIIGADCYSAIAVMGTISESGTWVDVEGRGWPYVVQYGSVGGVKVASDATLTIPAGTVVKLAHSGSYIYRRTFMWIVGILDAQGTESDPVYFTSERNDSLGGDSNRDGDSTVPAPGDWANIRIDNSTNTIEHCEFSYGGGAQQNYSNIYCVFNLNNSTPEIKHNRIMDSYSGSNGIYCRYSGTSPAVIVGNEIGEGCTNGINCAYTGIDAAPAYLDSNTVAGATQYGIYVLTIPPSSEINHNTVIDCPYGIVTEDASPTVVSNDISVTSTHFTPRYPFYQIDTSFPLYSSNIIGADCYPAVAVMGTISESGTWVDVEGRGWPYVVQYGSVGGVKVASGATLTIPAGTVVKLAHSGSYIYRRTFMWIAGILDLQTNESDPVYFTSERNDSLGGDSNGDGDATVPAPGDWANIRIDNSANTIEHCEFSYGGGAQENYSNIYCVFNLNNCTPAIRHNKITDSYSGSNGIYCRYNGTSPAVIVGNEIGEGCTNGINCAYTGIDAAPAYLDSNMVAGATQYGIYVLTIPSSSEINHNTVIDCPYGIVTEDASPTVASNDISVTSTHFTPRYPFYQIDTSFPVYSSNIIGADCYPAVAVTGTINDNGTWVDVEGRGWPYVVQYAGGVYGVKVASGATLTIPAGSVVKLAHSGSYIYRRTFMWIAGILDAQGTESNPVYFTSERNDSLGGDSNGDGDATVPAPGDWATIRIDNSANTIQHCEFSYGGGQQENYSNIYCVLNLNNCTPAIRYNRISDCYASGSSGIYCTYSGDTPVDIAGNIIKNGQNGIFCYYKGSFVHISNISDNSVSNVSGAGIWYHGNSDYSIVQISNNSVDSCDKGIRCENVKSGSQISGNTVSDCSTMALFCSEASLAIMNNQVYQTGGYIGSGDAIWLDNNSDAYISKNAVSNFTWGIYADTPNTVTIKGNWITDNSNAGVVLEGTASDGPDAVINNNDIYNNSSSNLYLGGYYNPDTRVIDARSNWWGTTDSTAIAGAIYDHADDPLSPTADFLPCRTGPILPDDPMLAVSPDEFDLSIFPSSDSTATMRIGNNGLIHLDYTISEAMGGGSAAAPKGGASPDAAPQTDLSWVTAYPASGSVPGDSYHDIDVTFAATVEGDYSGYLVINSNDDTRNPYVVPLDLHVSNIVLTSQSSPDTLRNGEHHDITWRTAALAAVQSVDIFLSTDDGRTFDPIALGETDDGLYDWQVPGEFSDSCLVKVVAHHSDTLESYDVCKSRFSIHQQPTAVVDEPVPPERCALYQNYPNPFNPQTTISYALHEAGPVRLTIYSVNGTLVRTLVDRGETAGIKYTDWDGTNSAGQRVSSGVYFYRLEAGSFIQTRKMVLLK